MAKVISNTSFFKFLEKVRLNTLPQTRKELEIDCEHENKRNALYNCENILYIL